MIQHCIRRNPTGRIAELLLARRTGPVVFGGVGDRASLCVFLRDRDAQTLE